MKQSTLISAIALCASVANGQGSYNTWRAPTLNDSRGPCPMLNTLANHQFLPHNGRTFSLDTVQTALKTALNFTEDLSELLHNFALKTNPAPNATTWGLDTLSNHNILEHDASLSRSDKYFTGNAVSFNATVFNQTRTWWTGDMIDIQMAADARLGRMLWYVTHSVKYNREFALSELAGDFSAGEGAAYLLVFGNRTEGTARKELVSYLFENERLPVELGWTTPNPVIGQDDLFNMSDKLVAATIYKAGEMKRLAL